MPHSYRTWLRLMTPIFLDCCSHVTHSCIQHAVRHFSKTDSGKCQKWQTEADRRETGSEFTSNIKDLTSHLECFSNRYLRKKMWNFPLNDKSDASQNNCHSHHMFSALNKLIFALVRCAHSPWNKSREGTEAHSLWMHSYSCMCFVQPRVSLFLIRVWLFKYLKVGLKNWSDCKHGSQGPLDKAG